MAGLETDQALLSEGQRRWRVRGDAPVRAVGPDGGIGPEVHAQGDPATAAIRVVGSAVSDRPSRGRLEDDQERADDPDERVGADARSVSGGVGHGSSSRTAGPGVRPATAGV